jgi:hypothetical protein
LTAAELKPLMALADAAEAKNGLVGGAVGAYGTLKFINAIVGVSYYFGSEGDFFSSEMSLGTCFAGATLISSVNVS